MGNQRRVTLTILAIVKSGLSLDQQTWAICLASICPKRSIWQDWSRILTWDGKSLTKAITIWLICFLYIFKYYNFLSFKSQDLAQTCLMWLTMRLVCRPRYIEKAARRWIGWFDHAERDGWDEMVPGSMWRRGDGKRDAPCCLETVPWNLSMYFVLQDFCQFCCIQ